MDALVVVLFRAISSHFKSLVDSANELVPKSASQEENVWESIRCEFELLCGLLKKLNEFLSLPLLLSHILSVLLMAMHVRLKV